MRNKLFLLLISMLLIIAPAHSESASIDVMIGQMILVGFKGDNLNSQGYKRALSQLNNNQISGLVFGEKNIKDKKSLNQMTESLLNSKSLARPFIAINEEGGLANSLSSRSGFKNYPSALSIAKNNSTEAYKAYFSMAQALKASLFNLNLAPCVDLDINKYSMIHKKQRSYSSNPDVVVKYANEFLKAHYDSNIITSLKHFPGYGNAIGDKDLSYVNTTNTVKEIELLPYENLLGQNNIQTVMVSHTYNKNRDAIYPASLSYYTVYSILRKQLDYKGVIITDSLDAPSLTNMFNMDEIVIQAINAGCDILYFSNYEANPALPDKISRIIKSALIDGQIEPARIEESYKRITKLKQNLILNEAK